MKYSIIFLIEEEKEEFGEYFDVIQGLLEAQGEEFETVVVANGAEGFIRAQLSGRRVHPEKVKVIVFPQKAPQPVCLKAALGECSGTEVLALGSYQELTTPSYEKLIHSMTEGVDLVIPYRKVRNDPLLNRIHSRMLNRAIRWMLGVKVHDVGCNAKLCRRELLDSLELYGSMFNYLPVVAAQKGFTIKEIECEQFHSSDKGKLYRLRQYVNRFSDLANLFFSGHFSRRPLRFFNLVGAGFFGLGVILLTYVGVQRAMLGVPIGARLLLIAGMISLVGGAQLASYGLLGEIIAFVHGRSRKEYTIEKII